SGGLYARLGKHLEPGSGCGGTEHHSRNAAESPERRAEQQQRIRRRERRTCPQERLNWMSTEPLARRYRTALVTGASTGLGHAFAEMLLREGVEVWGTARDVARLPPRERFHPVALELGNGDAAADVFRDADSAAKGFDIV